VTLVASGEYERLFSRDPALAHRLVNERKPRVRLVEVLEDADRHLFDRALDVIHYSKSCQRVGRCMRMAVLLGQKWVGGIVIGSTFPNILVRDEAIGLRRFVVDFRERGLVSPWSRENRPYWTALQTVVNHARAFTFPLYQGVGLGILAQRELLRQGRKLWEHKYSCRVYAFDNLCDSGDSKLFARNGWSLAGETKGFSSRSGRVFSRSAEMRRDLRVVNNVGLVHGDRRWQVWVKIVNRDALHTAVAARAKWVQPSDRAKITVENG
jgi:hypothetical protein